MKKAKKSVILVTPLLLFAVLLIPYSWVNQQYIVKWLGCGCPQIDELGNIVLSDFNANDFTALFWLFISVCATVFSIFLSKQIPRTKIWLRILYIIAICVGSLWITHQFTQMMMWK